MNKNKINIQSLIPFIEVFSKVISFINILLMMNLLPISDYADYAYIVAIVVWASFIMDGGINNLVFNKSLKNENEEFSNLFSSRTLLSFLILIVLIIYFSCRKPEIAVSAILFSFIMVFNTSSVFIKMIARGKKLHQVDTVTILSEALLRLFIFLVLFLTLKNLEWRLWHFMLIYLVAGIISFNINYITLNRYVSLKLYVQNIQSFAGNLIKTVKVSKYFLLYGVIYTGITKIDIIFLETYSNKYNLALFSSAIVIYEVILLFFFTIITTHFREIYQNQKKYLLYISVFTTLSILLTFLLSSVIFDVMLPEKYFESYVILNHLIFGLLPSVLVFYFIFKLNFEDRSKVNSILLLFIIIAKASTYLILKPLELSYYNFIFPFFEYFAFLSYLGYSVLFYKKQSNPLELNNFNK